MTDIAINPVTRRIEFSGQTITGPFNFSFNILQASDIAVYKNNTLLTIGTGATNYSVSINANGTGSVSVVTALIATDVLVIIGGRELSRTTDFVTAGDLLASSLNEQLDSNVVMSQQLDESIDRSIRAQPGDSLKTLTLPLVADRASEILTFDASGNVTTTPVSEIVGADIDTQKVTIKTSAGATKLVINGNIADLITAADNLTIASTSGDIDLKPGGGQVNILAAGGQQRILFDNSAQATMKYFQNSNTTTLGVVDPTGTRALLLPDASDTLVGKATTDTLTNKTLASPVITGSLAVGTLTNSGTDITLDSSGDIVLDADGGQIYFKDGGATKLTWNLGGSQDLVSNDEFTLKTDSSGISLQPQTGNTDFLTNSGNQAFQVNAAGSSTITYYQNSNTTKLGVVNPTGTRTLLLPDASDTLVGKDTTDTLTNKTLASPTITGSLAVGTLTNSGSDIILDSSGDITLDADGGEIYFKDGGATRLTFQVSAVAAQLNSASDFNVNSANDIALQPAGGQVDILGTSGQQRIQFDNSASPFVKYYQNSNTTTLGVVNPTGTRALLLPDASDTLVGKATTDTLTNKTLTSPTITGSLDMSDVNITNVGSISLDKITNDGGAGITLDSSSNIIIDASSGTFFFKDDNVTRLTVAINNSASQSITSLADLTLVSGDDTFIKPSGGQVYIQTSAGADNFQFNVSSTPTLGIHQNSNVTNLGLVNPTATRTILFPDASDTLVGKATTDTLTNKTLSAPAVTGNATFGDNDKAIFGAGSDLQIYHDGSNSYLKDSGTGDLYIQGEANVRITDGDGNKMFLGQNDGEVQLYHNGSEKLNTNSTGVDITGNMIAKGYLASEATNSTNKWLAYTYTDNTFRLNYNGAGADEVVIDSSGRVGIGISPDSTSNGKSLQINRTVMNDDDGGFFHMSQNGYYNSGWKYVENGTAEKISLSSGATIFERAVSNSGGADASLSWLESMRIDAAAQVYTTASLSAGANANMANGFVADSGAVYTRGTVSSNARSNNGGYLSGFAIVNGDNSANGGGAAGGRIVANVSALVVTSDGNAGDDSGGDLVFSTKPESGNLTERMRLLSGGGLTFNGDTAAANALNDYEEGTWTPALATAGVNVGYSVQSGVYTKIGNMVTCRFQINLNAMTSNGSGQVFIGGLPYNTDTSGINANFGRSPLQVYNVNFLDSAFDMLLFVTSTERMGILFGADNTSWTVGTVDNWVVSSSSIFTATFSYITDA